MLNCAKIKIFLYSQQRHPSLKKTFKSWFCVLMKKNGENFKKILTLNWFWQNASGAVSRFFHENETFPLTQRRRVLMMSSRIKTSLDWLLTIFQWLLTLEANTKPVCIEKQEDNNQIKNNEWGFNFYVLIFENEESFCRVNKKIC